MFNQCNQRLMLTPLNLDVKNILTWLFLFLFLTALGTRLAYIRKNIKNHKRKTRKEIQTKKEKGGPEKLKLKISISQVPWFVLQCTKQWAPLIINVANTRCYEEASMMPSLIQRRSDGFWPLANLGFWD